MKQSERVVSNLIFIGLCLLAILLIGENYVVIPVWLWPFGRMHPLLLHFPIAFIVLLAILRIFQHQLEPGSFEKVQKFLLYFTAFTTTLTALMGFFLSKEPGYVSELMAFHKWIGVGVAFLVYGLVLTYHKKRAYNGLLMVCLIAIVFAGHLGAGLTHGMNFLIEPIMATTANPLTKQTPIYSGLIAPIFIQKCQGCHNLQKQKGGLDMSSLDKMYAGGENGSVWQDGNAKESEIVKRASLPTDHEHHMPPKGKAQLTPAEFNLIYQWIANGADTAVAISHLPESDTLFVLASAMLNKKKGSDLNSGYDFDFVSKKVIKSLNNPYRSVAQITPSSPAISVNIYVRQAYKKEFLNELNQIKDQIVFLNLTNLPIEDEELSVIARFKNLEKLNLNSTNISGKTLDMLSACANLKSLSLGSTDIDLNMLSTIPVLENLEELFVWNTGINHEDLQVLKDQYPGIEFHMGYSSSDDPPLKLSPPMLKNTNLVIERHEKISLVHKLNGTSIRYTLDGSEPDSLLSTIYENPFEVGNTVSIKTKAYHENWLSSDTKTYSFFVKGFTADSAILLTDANPKYMGGGAISLIDHKKGEARNFNSTEWLGYQGKTMSALIDLGVNPQEINEVALCYGVNTQSYIMPPINVSVYGGNQPEALAFLGKVSPQVLRGHQSATENIASIPIAKGRYQYYKIVAEPLVKLPVWHDGAGSEAWVFVDEVFFY